MSFSVIASHLPQDEAGWGQWLLEHAREHRRFTDALLGQTPSVATAEFPIETMGDDPQPWLGAHMEMSQSVWSGLGGGQSEDFRYVDWNDQKQIEQWFLNHDRWHATVRDALGL